jgi:hypothetical protein
MSGKEGAGRRSLELWDVENKVMISGLVLPEQHSIDNRLVRDHVFYLPFKLGVWGHNSSFAIGPEVDAVIDPMRKAAEPAWGNLRNPGGIYCQLPELMIGNPHF